jgi:Inverse autotransporter, beta-domain
VKRLLLFCSIAGLQCSTVLAGEAKWRTRIDVQGKFTEGDVRSEVDVLAPVWQSDTSLLLLSLRGQFDDSSNQEGSAGVVYRRMLSNDFNIGAYAFVDVRNTRFDNTFIQSVVGVEALGRDFEFRANGYAPISSGSKEAFVSVSSATSTVSEELSNIVGAPRAEVLNGALAIVRDSTTRFLLTDTRTTTATTFSERSLSGFDAEIGWRPPFGDINDNLQFRVFAGGFYFNADGVTEVTGPRARAELRVHNVFGVDGARFSIGGEFRHDDVRGSQGFGVARLRLPLQFGKNKRRLTGMERRMLDPIVRDPDIVVNQFASGAVSAATDIETRVEEVQALLSESAVHVSNGVTVGSVVNIDATDDFAATVQAAGENALIILDGVAGDIAGGATLLPGQTLVGGAQTLDFVGATSGLAASFAINTATPTLTAGFGENLVTVADNTTIRGVTFQTPDSGAGIFSGNGASQIVIADNVFRNVANARGIAFNTLLSGGFPTHENILIENNQFLADAAVPIGDAITIGRSLSNIIIRNNVMEGGLFIRGGRDVLIEGNVISASLGNLGLIGATRDVVVRGNTLSGFIIGQRVWLSSGSFENILFTDNIFERSVFPQLSIDSTVTSINGLTLNNNQFDGQGPEDVLFDLRPGSYAGSGNIVSLAGGAALVCNESGLAADYLGPGFGFTSGAVCGDGP